MADNVNVWRKIERNLFRKLGVYKLRFTPMSVSEQCTLERKMLEHFGLAYTETTNVYSQGQYQTYKHWKIRDDKRARQAISISQAFFRLAELPDAPIDAKEMELAVRYEMGYGWLAWFFFRNFAWPIIQWLWNRYHNPDPVGSPAT